MQKLLDTNTLLNGATEGILTYPVLVELDKLKTSEGLTGKKARDAVNYIYRNLEKFEILPDQINFQSNEKVDDFLLRVAEERNLNLITYDLSLYLKGLARKIKCDFGLEEDIEYNGVSYLTEEQFNDASLIDTSLYPENHFFIYGQQVFVIEHGEMFEIEPGIIKTNFNGEVRGRNPEQVALIAAFEADIPVILVTGGYGTGNDLPL